MQQEKQISVARGCRLFGQSRQSIYQAERRARERAAEKQKILPLVYRVRGRMPRLGTRKLHYLLRAEFEQQNVKIGRDALFDCLRAENLLIKRTKNYRKTTDSKHWLRKHPNVLKELQVSRPEQVFVSDITYLRSRENTHYLSLVTDAFSRKIMGYHLSDDLSAESALAALQMAIRERRTTEALIHHSDRGLQYASALYQELLQQHQIKASMTEAADCYQNALAERMNKILKEEFLIYPCKTKKELELLIKESVQTYNNERPHLSLQMKTPEFVHRKAGEITGSN